MSFNMVKTITQGTINSTLTYDSDHSRIVQHLAVTCELDGMAPEDYIEREIAVAAAKTPSLTIRETL